jgi:hypothetical protein
MKLMQFCMSFSSALDKIYCLSQNGKVHYRIHNSQPLNPTQTKFKPLHILTQHSFKVHFNIILRSMHRPPNFFSECSFLYSSPAFVLTSCPFHILWVDFLNGPSRWPPAIDVLIHSLLNDNIRSSDCITSSGVPQLQRNDTRAETSFRLSSGRTRPYTSGRGDSVVLLEKICLASVWTLQTTHSIVMFPLQFPSA